MNSPLIDPLDTAPQAVRLQGLYKDFGDRRALDGLDLAVPEGAVYVLVGPNGAGKTTTLKILLDLLRPDSGSAEAFGVPVVEEGPWVRAQVGFVADDHSFGMPQVSVGILLDHHRRYFGTWDDGYAQALTRRLEIDRKAIFGKLSKGQARRVQLLLALAHRPALLLMDEPTDGLDPLARENFAEILADHLAAAPTTLLLSTHLVHEVEGLGDHLGVIRAGRVLAQLSRDDLNRRLHRLRAMIPEAWSPPPEVAAAVVGRRAAGREIEWTVAGDRQQIQEAVAGSGATVHELRALNLEEASKALLKMERPR